MGPTTSNLALQGNTGGTGNSAVRASTRPAQPAREASDAAAAKPSATVSAAESAASVRQAVDEANEALRSVSAGVEFSLDEGSGKVIVRVVDSETDEVLRQIPSEQMLAISRAIDDLRGLLIKQEA